MSKLKFIVGPTSFEEDVIELICYRDLLSGSSMIRRTKKFPAGSVEIEVKRTIHQVDKGFSEILAKLEKDKKFVALVEEASSARRDRWIYYVEDMNEEEVVAIKKQNELTDQIIAILEAAEKDPL